MQHKNRFNHQHILAVVLLLSAVVVAGSQGSFSAPVYGSIRAPRPEVIGPLQNVTSTVTSTSTSTGSTTTTSVSTSSSTATTVTTLSTTSTSTATTFTAIYPIVTTTTTAVTATLTSTSPVAQYVSPDFFLSANPAFVYLPVGDFVGTTDFVLGLTSLGGWMGPLQFTTSPLPRGISLYNFPTAYSLSTANSSWDVLVTISRYALPGSYPILFSAIGILPGGTTTHTATLTILVQPLPLPEFPQSLALVSSFLLLIVTAEFRRRRRA